MKSTSSDAHAWAIFLAIRQTNFSDSMTHGPRINTGRLPPMVTFRTLSDLNFHTRETNQEKQEDEITRLPPASLPSEIILFSLYQKWRTAHEHEKK